MPDATRRCGTEGCESPASVHLVQVVNNKTANLFLCGECAKAKGHPASVALTAVVAQMGDDEKENSLAQRAEDDPCSFCGMSLDDFKESGRVGCSHCYTAFEAKMRGLLSRIHGSSQHLGKVYLPPDPTVADLDRRLSSLRRRLERAVEAEDFEQAATLRDQISEMETTGQKAVEQEVPG